MEKEINNLHEACSACREGFKWAGSDCGGQICAFTTKAEGRKLYSTEDSAGESFWQLYRQISFMVMGSEPFNSQTCELDTAPEGKLDCVTAEDLITITACVKRASKF